MNISIEITMYPLHEDYETQVLSFLSVFTGNNAFTYKVNAMSTQVQGELEALMDWLKVCISEVYQSGVKAVFIQKIISGKLNLDYTYKK